MDIHEEQSNIWGPKIDRMKISEYKIIANIRRSFCTIQNEVHFTPDFAVRTNYVQGCITRWYNLERLV